MLECVLIAGIGFIQIEASTKAGIYMILPPETHGITIPLEGTVLKTERDWDKGTKTFTFIGDYPTTVVRVFTYNHMMGGLRDEGVGYSDWHWRGATKILEGCK